MDQREYYITIEPKINLNKFNEQIKMNENWMNKKVMAYFNE
jgi:hypothetical protein